MLFDSYGKYIFYDGAMGTMLHKAGLKPGDKPDIMNMTMPDAVENINRMYIEAGSDIICTNTFGANALNLEGTGYTPEEIITAAVAIAKRAIAASAEAVMPPETTKTLKASISPGASVSPSMSALSKASITPVASAPPQTATPPKVALDIGPTGQLLEPFGGLEPERAYELFSEMAVAGEKAGADFAAIETMSDLEEIKAAMSAVKENTSLPILATMTFDKTGRTFMGCTAESFVEAAELIGAAAVGLNCSLEPPQMLETAKRIVKATKLPLIIKPNAGLPDVESGRYNTGAEEFAAQMIPYAKLGARIVGGCCGTTPEYIRALREAFSEI